MDRAIFAARNSGRYALSAVRIERRDGQCRALATDGQRAILFHWDEPDPQGFPPIEGLSARAAPRFGLNIPPKALADAARGLPRRCIKPILDHILLDESGGDTVRLAATTLQNVTRAEARAEEGTFPPIDDVVPRPAQEGNTYEQQRHGELAFSHVRIGVNARLLARTLQTLADLAAEDPGSTVVLTVPVTPSNPLRLDARCPGRPVLCFFLYYLRLYVIAHLVYRDSDVIVLACRTIQCAFDPRFTSA